MFPAAIDADQTVTSTRSGPSGAGQRVHLRSALALDYGKACVLADLRVFVWHDENCMLPRRRLRMAKVTVYYFRVWNQDRRQYLISARPATRERIESLKGNLIEDTAQEVEASRLDGAGFLSYTLPKGYKFPTHLQ